MATNLPPGGSDSVDPAHAAILKAIDDIKKSAAKMSCSPGHAIRHGFINTEVQAKLISLQTMLTAFTFPSKPQD